MHYRHDVRILYKYCMSLEKDDNYVVTLLIADGHGNEVINGVNIKDLGKPIGGRFGRVIIGSLKVAIYLFKNKASILHFHDPELIPIASIAKLMGAKVIFDMHENLPLQILTKSYLPKYIKISLNLITKLYQRIAFMYIPVIFAEKSYRRYFPFIKKQTVVLNYPLKDSLINTTNPKNKTFTVGYMGGINIERGTLITLEAIASVKKQNKQIRGLFIGPYSAEISDNDLFKKSVEDKWASFLGRMEPQKGWEEMSKCDVGLAILQDSPNFIESYPTKIFEYMLLGIPIIVSDFPLYREIIESCKCGIAVNPSSKKEIAEAFLYFMNNPDQTKIMGKRGKEIALQKYIWESEFLKVKSFYSSLLIS